MDNNGDDKEPLDIYRDTPIRLLGYANEVGESFRYVIPVKAVHATYAIATLYCLADTLDKSFKSLKKENAIIKDTIIIAADTMTWQLLASVIVPGYTINRICALSNNLLIYSNLLSAKARTRTIPFIGLAVIPFIIRPIDHLVDKFMDITFRKLV